MKRITVLVSCDFCKREYSENLEVVKTIHWSWGAQHMELESCAECQGTQLDAHLAALSEVSRKVEAPVVRTEPKTTKTVRKQQRKTVFASGKADAKSAMRWNPEFRAERRKLYQQFYNEDLRKFVCPKCETPALLETHPSLGVHLKKAHNLYIHDVADTSDFPYRIDPVTNDWVANYDRAPRLDDEVRHAQQGEEVTTENRSLGGTQQNASQGVA